MSASDSKAAIRLRLATGMTADTTRKAPKGLRSAGSGSDALTPVIPVSCANIAADMEEGDAVRRSTEIGPLLDNKNAAASFGTSVTLMTKDEKVLIPYDEKRRTYTPAGAAPAVRRRSSPGGSVAALGKRILENVAE